MKMLHHLGPVAGDRRPNLFDFPVVVCVAVDEIVEALLKWGPERKPESIM